MLTRRGFLLAAGSGAVSAAVPSLVRPRPGRSAPGGADTVYLSRPDLVPPDVAVTTPATETAAGLVFVACQSPPGQPEAGRHGPTIVDDDGELVWFRSTAGRTAADFRVQRYRGRPVLVWWEGGIVSGHGSGEYVVLDGSYEEVARVRAGNGLSGDLHEFRLTTRGTALLTAYVAAPADLSPLGGPTDGTVLDSVVQEVDVASGRVLLEWRARDHLAPDETYAPVSNGVLDHAHLNSVDVWDEHSLLVSARHTWALYRIDRRTGAILWRLGGKRSDFAVEPAAQFAWQHHARRRADGSLTVFDNGNGPLPVEPYSRGLRLHVDERARTVTLLQELRQPDALSARAMGSVQPLPNGGTFVGWGTVPAYSEFGPDGSLRLHAQFPAGGPSYRAERHEWHGLPRDAPALAAGVLDGARYAFASWNGATGVARWRLLAGADDSSLRGDRVVRRSGFETRLPVPAHARRVAVEALDARGAILGRSRTVPA